jgi:hypothetical protein
MDDRWGPQERDAAREIVLWLYPAHASPMAIRRDAFLPLRDLTPLTSRLEQTHAQLTFTLSWQDELDGANMVAPGQWLVLWLNGKMLCIHKLDSLSDYRLMSGVKQITVTARSRDLAEHWRERTIATKTYAIGAPTIGLVRDVAYAMGLEHSELRLRQTGTYVPRASMQLANVSSWTVLEQVMQPAGLTPCIDALGRLYGVSRDVFRRADVVLTDDRVEGLSASRSRGALTHLTLKWRAPLMKVWLRPEQVLGETSMTAGWFKLQQVKNIYFSKDKTMRATNIRMVIRESCNEFFHFANEEMKRFGHDAGGETGAMVSVTTSRFVPTFLGTYMALKIATSFIPDFVVALFGGVTISFGRLFKAGADISALMVLLSFGTGRYQILGQMLDQVEEVNETVAYDPTASPAAYRTEVIENDFIGAEGTAIGMVTREFVYRARAATNWTLSIVDDPRIEVGDIVQLEDGTRLFVMGYRRSLSPGDAALLELVGFPA